ncbi:MAG: Ig-like domain-containing protein [Tannerella sp.]|jgi:hypothetical protein|nr:Ig-like domain-containing protein [Tannerella sp.]
MKARFLLSGYLVACLCLAACNDDKEVTVSDITLSPETIPALEVGGTVELTATVTPTDATEEIRWVAYDEIVSIKGEGRTAVLTALASGTTKVFATNRTGVVVSKEITVKVNSSEYAGFVVGKYSGTARVSGAINADLSGVSVTLERIKDENAQVKLTVLADVPGLNELTITADHVEVKPGTEPETYTLSGAAPLEALSATLTVSGTYRAADKSLALSLVAENLINISIAATPGAPADYGAATAGNYTGTAQLTGMLTADLTDVRVALTRLSNTKSGLAVTATVPGMGEQVISSEDVTLATGSEPNTCSLSGKALMPAMNFELNLTGTFNLTTHALTLTLVEINNQISIQIAAAPVGFDPSDYGAMVAGKYLGSARLSGSMTDELSGVQTLLERVDNGTVKLNVTAAVPGMGEVPIVGESITVSEGETPGTCVLGGTATGMGMEFGVVGTYQAAGKTLTLQLAVEGVITIDLTAEAQEDEPQVDYVEIVTGGYTGSAELNGVLNTTLADVPVTLEAIDGETEIVKFTMEATIPDMGKMTIVCEELTIVPGTMAGTCTFSGTATLPVLNLPLDVTGMYTHDGGTLAVTLKAEGAITIAYGGIKNDPTRAKSLKR